MKDWRIVSLVCGIICLVCLGGANAQEKYPSRQIELVIPHAPGGSPDIIARVYSDKLAQILKVPVTVVNRAGGGGIQGTTYVALAKKDGYTLLGTTTGTFMITPLTNVEAKYSLKDFITLSQIAFATTVISVRSDSPIKTFGNLIEYARKNPGKLKDGQVHGVESHFNLQIICAKNNIIITQIPYKSGGEAMIDLLGGHLDMITGTPAVVSSQIKAGKIRGLVITRRHPDFPDIPTTAELGYPDGTFLLVRQGLFAPAGVSQSVLDVLIPAVEKVFKDPEVCDRAMKAGFTAEYIDPIEFQKVIESETQIVKKIIESQVEKK